MLIHAGDISLYVYFCSAGALLVDGAGRCRALSLSPASCSHPQHYLQDVACYDDERTVGRWAVYTWKPLLFPRVA